SHTGLNFIGDEKRAVLAAQCRRAAEIFVGGKVDPFPLDRLDDEGREVTLPKLALQRLQIVERDRAAFRQKGAEALAEDAVAIQRQRSIGQAVEAMLAVEYAGAAGRGARELDRRFHRFRAGVAAEQI